MSMDIDTRQDWIKRVCLLFRIQKKVHRIKSEESEKNRTFIRKSSSHLTKGDEPKLISRFLILPTHKELKMATKKSNNPLTAMSAGCIAGAVEATCVWPMEYMKTQLQLKGSKLPYNGVLQGLSYTVRTTGFLRYVAA